MKHEAAFRGPYRGSASRVSQARGTDELREMAGAGRSSLCRYDDGSFPTTTSSPSPRGRSAAVEDSTRYAGAVDAGGAAAAATQTEFSIEVSYLEIYNESLRDLFNPATPAAAGSHSGNGGGSAGEWGVGVADSGGGGGASTGNGLRLREDPT